MIDTREFRDRYTQALLHVAAEHNGVGDVEAYRRYQTDATFHAQVDALVGLAVQVLANLDVAETPDYAAAFWDEANSLLGWSDDH